MNELLLSKAPAILGPEFSQDDAIYEQFFQLVSAAIMSANPEERTQNLLAAWDVRASMLYDPSALTITMFKDECRYVWGYWVTGGSGEAYANLLGEDVLTKRYRTRQEA